jgi:hypothetical protein
VKSLTAKRGTPTALTVGKRKLKVRQSIMRKIKCNKCQDKRVVLVKQVGVPHGDYYELCVCKQKDEGIKMRTMRRSLRPGPINWDGRVLRTVPGRD